jgi:hypothetical protein
VKRTTPKDPKNKPEKPENPKTAACRLFPASSVTGLLEAVPAVLERHANQYVPAMTRQKQRDFLLVLSRTGQHSKSCAAVQIATSTPYDWADRSVDFAKKLKAAQEMGEKVLLAAYEADLDAVVAEPLFIQHTQNLRMFRIKRLDPRYRDSVAAVQVNVGPAAIVMNIDDDPAPSGQRAIADGKTGH